MMSLDFSKALSIPGYLISLIKHELNIWTPCRTSLFVITAKTLFSNSLLISLCCESVNGAFCTRTDISACGDCLADIPVELADMPAELADMPAELADMPAEVMWFSVTGFSFAGCFRGRPRPRFIVGSTGSASSLGASRVDRGASNLSGSAVASSLSGSTSWVVSGRK